MIILTRTRRIDWAAVVDDIRRTGMTQREIGAAVDVTREAVSSYCDARCVEPAFWTGSALLVLWAGRMGRSYADAPVRVVTPAIAAVMRIA